LYLSYIISAVLSFLFIKKYFKGFKFENIFNYTEVVKNLWKYGFYNQLATIAQLLSFRMSYYFLEKTWGMDKVGIYSNGVSIAESIWLITRSISLIEYSSISNSTDINYSKKLSANFHKMSLIMCLIVLIPMLVIPAQVYQFIFGAGFGKVREVIVILGPGVLAFNTVSVLGHYFSGTGKFFVNSLVSGIGLLTTIIFAILLIPHFSIFGASMATSASYFTSAIIVIYFYLRETKSSLKDVFPNFNDVLKLKSEVKTILISLKK
jgi:O-antigen/teichoic acid export membrane protein